MGFQLSPGVQIKKLPGIAVCPSKWGVLAPLWTLPAWRDEGFGRQRIDTDESKHEADELDLSWLEE